MSGQNETGESVSIPSAGLWMSWIDDATVLRRRALRLTKGNREDAEDLLSATLIKAVSHVERNDTDIREPRAFLLFAMKNEYISRLRKLNSERQVRDFQADIYQDHSSSLGDPQPDQENSLGYRDLLHRLLQAVGAMPEEVQVIFQMRFCEDCSYRDIAERLCISEPLARKRVQHLREYLRAALETASGPSGYQTASGSRIGV
ncbi:RNA polymerase sigma factor [Roseibium sediminis]|uniref:RNA polymerase sigma factor n=1 Tax=Roseibium sediminis TaxID=1775174 RepID=UPI001AD91C35|nr:RNA polymerase sigma factor [Roseibium sediminis]